MDKRKAYYMRQGTHLIAMVAYSKTEPIQSEFDLYEFSTFSQAKEFDRKLGSDLWWIAE